MDDELKTSDINVNLTEILNLTVLIVLSSLQPMLTVTYSRLKRSTSFPVQWNKNVVNERGVDKTSQATSIVLPCNCMSVVLSMLRFLPPHLTEFQWCRYLYEIEWDVINSYTWQTKGDLKVDCNPSTTNSGQNNKRFLKKINFTFCKILGVTN